MTPREVFERVRDHLLSQGRRAEDAFRCRYRTEEGLRCAVGCLIGADDYSPAIEAAGVSELEPAGDRWVPSQYLSAFRRKQAEPLALALNGSGVTATRETLGLLLQLQLLHDRHDPAEWATALGDMERGLAASRNTPG